MVLMVVLFLEGLLVDLFEKTRVPSLPLILLNLDVANFDIYK